jgi:hypothetical protein
MCYSCLCEYYPEILHKNPSKLFNTCGKYVKTAFYVTDEDFVLQKSKHGVTKESMILKYGNIIGEEKWNTYLELQKVTNTFEYKSKDKGYFNRTVNFIPQTEGKETIYKLKITGNLL